jgi:hypothetical protein
MSEAQTCPRRMAGYPYAEGMAGPDEWRTDRAGLIGQGSVGSSCSYCGSLHPDRFMELVREGWIVGPTDKSYKAYLGRPVTDEDRTRIKAAWHAEPGGIAETVRAMGVKDGKTAEQVDADIAILWRRQEQATAGSCGQEAKFYFQHLSDDQKREFVDLLSANAMQVGYPGYFYSPPFFMTYAA